VSSPTVANSAKETILPDGAGDGGLPERAIELWREEITRAKTGTPCSILIAKTRCPQVEGEGVREASVRRSGSQ